MAAWTARLGTLLTIVALALTPAVRVLCLAMCASPVGVARASVDTPRIDHAAHGPSTHHVHHHSSATADASTAAVAETRCDAARRGGCGNANGVAPLPAGRTPGADTAIAPPVSRLAAAGLRSRAHAATPLIRVPPPGPPPAAIPLRI